MTTDTEKVAPEMDFAAALRAAVERMREASRADIIALYPYDEESDSFYAPVAIGLSEHDVINALPDLSDQLRRFRSDAAEGKVSADLTPAQYGPSAWLLTMRRPLISADATREVETSFVRRHKITAIVALPLQVGDRVVGLLYLNYVERARGQNRVVVTDDDYKERMESVAADVAAAIDSARHSEESRILQAISGLVHDFSTLSSSLEDEGVTTRRLEDLLGRGLAALNLNAAALYIPESGAQRLTLLAAEGCPALAGLASSLPFDPVDVLTQNETLVRALAEDKLHPLRALTLRGQGHVGVLVVADRDSLTLQRRLPANRALLQTATDLLGAALNTGYLVDALGEMNRTMGAVTRLSQRLLQPGATQGEALRTAVSALTDPALPELDFEFAAIYLLDRADDGSALVSTSAGATASPAIHSVVDASQESDSAGRVPTWATGGVRRLDARDVLTYVSTRRRPVVVAPVDGSDEHFVAGYPEDRLERLAVPILDGEGNSTGYVHAARLRGAADRAPLRSSEDAGSDYRITDEFTLNAELFETYGHGSLVRVFLPFGLDESGERATGVLEAGYHVSREQRLERAEIEALRACAATIAVAMETARLYEDVTQRAKQLEIMSEVSRTITTSIDLEQTLHLVACNMARAVDAPVCFIALMDEDGSAWYGAAASDSEEIWRHRRVERPERSIVFEVVDTGRPVVVEDAQNNELISAHFARLLGTRSLMALPLLAGEAGAIGVVLLAERERQRLFTPEEVERAAVLAGQAALAIRNARLHAREEEEQHIQKDVVLVGFGQWGQKAYQHLLILKSFFNFRTHVVEMARPGRREALAEIEQTVLANGDAFYWDSPETPAHEALARELEPSCYVVTYIVTPAETHLPLLKTYYDLSNVVLIEKPLGAPPEEYRNFIDTTDGSVQIIAADHYWFKIEVRLLQLLLTEERNLRAFLDEIEEVEIEILEEQTPSGSGAQIGMIADLIPHAFAVLSLVTPLDRVKLAQHQPLQIGRYQPVQSEHETYARLVGSFEHRGRPVRLTIDVGKGVTDAKWIKLIGERRMGGRRSFYKFDFTKGEVMDGTQSALRAATRPIRQPGVPDNAHLGMLRHVIEKKHPAVGILSIREALRANARIQELEQMASEQLAAGKWTPYGQGQRPDFPGEDVVQITEAREVGARSTSG